MTSSPGFYMQSNLLLQSPQLDASNLAQWAESAELSDLFFKVPHAGIMSVQQQQQPQSQQQAPMTQEELAAAAAAAAQQQQVADLMFGVGDLLPQASATQQVPSTSVTSSACSTPPSELDTVSFRGRRLTGWPFKDMNPEEIERLRRARKYVL